MGVIRINKTSNYTVMSNHHFKDRRLSLKAKGLLSEMLSLPDDWDYTVAGLAAINKEAEPAIKTALMELKECGYLIVTKLMPNETESGRIEYVYDIYEIPEGEERKPEPKPKQPKVDQFEVFWNAYPKKKNKETAKRAFERAIKKTDLETMLTAIEKQKHSKQWKEDNGQYIPYPATWLNGGAWEDEVEAADPKPVKKDGTSKRSALEELAKKMGVDT